MANEDSIRFKNLSDSHFNQIHVLRVLSRGYDEDSPKPFHINEIAQLSGLKDEKETQRYLFILEGQKLVCPLPHGDFTSRIWHITSQGAHAVLVIEQASEEGAAA